MADYFLDDAANGTNDGASWATCYNTWAQVASAGILTSSNRLIVGADANITDPGAALTITGPTSGLPAVIISSTAGSGTTVSYAVGTGKQVDTTAGANSVTFDGSFAVYGLKIASGKDISLTNDLNEFIYTDSVRALPAASAIVSLAGTSSRAIHKNLVVDLTADGSSARTGSVLTIGSSCVVEIDGLTFVNAGYRTGAIFSNTTAMGELRCSGADFSGFTNATECELLNWAGIYDEVTLSNCKTKASYVAGTGTQYTAATAYLYNVGPADNPAGLGVYGYLGTCISSTSIYRTGGAAAEGVAAGWSITTTALCAENSPFCTPWIYGTVASTGSKTFDLYITNDTADFTDAEVWLEIEYLKDADGALWTLATDQRATITTTAAAQTDDTTSSWNGTGPSFTYKQKLSVTATVGEEGQYRARVAVGVASIAGSRYFYVDPKITVT
jgi:hypothetical protein